MYAYYTKQEARRYGVLDENALLHNAYVGVLNEDMFLYYAYKTKDGLF